MMTDTEILYSPGEFHRFQAAGEEFVYAVPSGGIFAPDEPSFHALELLKDQQLSGEALLAGLEQRGHSRSLAEDTITEIYQARLIRDQNGFHDPPQEPGADFPLQSVVLNLTNQCNLSCQYCYEYGEDKVATPDGKPKFMGLEVAQAAVDHLFESSQGRQSIHITFFGGGH